MRTLSRRSFLGAGLAIAGRSLGANGRRTDVDPSVVSLIRGENRRQIVHDALLTIADQLMPAVRTRKYVLIKPNLVSSRIQLAATHPDALRGILDFLAPRFSGPVVIAESSAEDTRAAFDNFRYAQVAAEYKPLDVRLIDLNAEPQSARIHLLNENLHAQPVRLAARLFDPEAFVLCAAVLKTHDRVIATLSVKNLVMGAPLHYAPGETTRWNDKPLFHPKDNVRQTHFNLFLAAQRMRPFWGAAVIDGFEGMEGDGPTQGTPVPARVAIASTDLVAADRVGIEVMGVDPAWPGYLNFCGQAGLGQWDLAHINVWGVQPADVRRAFRLHRTAEQQLQWMGPIPACQA